MVRIYHKGYHEEDVEVELHFMPGVMNNPLYNYRLQAFCREHINSIASVELPNGVGRIPVLSTSNEKGEMKNEKLKMTLKRLNLYNFAGAVMYVMREVLGLEEKYLLVSIDKRFSQGER